MKNKLLELKNINVVYTNPEGEKFNALKEINVSIYEGDYVAILGTSGSGKTTLSQIIGMLNNSFDGEYFFQEEPIHKFSDKMRVRLRGSHIGFIFQDYVLLDYLTAEENVALAMQYENRSKKEILKLAREKLIAVGLGDKLHHKPHQLSGGQKQRVAIARALVKTPKVIIADEPTGALDQNSRIEILSLLQELNDAGVTIITVTHSQEDAQASKRIIRVEKGSVISDEIQRKRNTYFGKNLNLDDLDEKEKRSERILNYLSLNYGCHSLDEFKTLLNSSAVEDEVYNLLQMIRDEWIQDKDVLTFLNDTFDKGDDLVRLLSTRYLFSVDEALCKEFLRSPWNEEASMYFLTRFSVDEIEKYSTFISLQNFTSHDSKKVRASSMVLLKALGDSFLTEKEEMIKRFLSDSDNRVRANLLDYLFTLDYLPEFLNDYHFEKDTYSRVRASWGTILLWKGLKKEAMDIAQDLFCSDNINDILSGIWVAAQTGDFDLKNFVIEWSSKNPLILSHVDSVIQTYERAISQKKVNLYILPEIEKAA